MKKIQVKHTRLLPIIGYGYWKDVYQADIVCGAGVLHNIILPFLHIQYGYFYIENQSESHEKTFKDRLLEEMDKIRFDDGNGLKRDVINKRYDQFYKDTEL